MSETKLFGNRRNAARVAHGGRSQDGAKRHRLTGVQKGAVLLTASVLILAITVFAVYKDFVKPVERPATTVQDPDVPEDEVFTPPKVVQVETQIDDETGEEIEVEVEVPASHKDGYYNILIVGTDDDGTRTDTIMIGRMNTVDHTVALLSIPRDTLIDSTMAVPKINGVYGGAGKGENGIKALQRQLAKLLGFEVDGYAIVNLDAFIELVDLVGGVEFDVPMRMYYSDPSQDLYIDLQAGVQLLDGEKAMQLVRFRKGYATQDIMRTQVQQQFLQALAKKCLSVVNLTKIGDMAEIFLDNVTTDLTLGNIVYFGQELLKCDFDNMYSYTLEGEAVMMNGVSYFAIYQNKTLTAVNDYFNPYETDITAANVTILTPEYVRSIQSTTTPTEETPAEEVPAEGTPEEELPEGESPEEQLPEEELPEVDDNLPTDDWIIEDPLMGGN